MSEGHAQIPNWMVRDTSISGSAKLVYVCLTSRTTYESTAFPSHATMAREASISITTVKKALAELKALGVVDWDSRTKDDGGRTSNIYRIYTSPPRQSAPTP